MIYLAPLIFAVAMAIKGGWLGKIKGYNLPIEGAYVSGILLSAYINPVFGIAWAFGNRPAMNDPAGSNWKLAVQRGVFTGACLTLASGNVWYILAGATMPIWYRLAIRWSNGQSWAWAEPMFGAVFGVAYLMPILIQYLIRIVL